MILLRKTGKLLFALLVIATLFFIVYVNREKYIPVYEDILLATGLEKPCSRPIIYYIDQFDGQFGQSKEEFEKNLLKAADVWNNAVNKELFRYSPTEAEKMSNLSKRKLAVNLIFDERQETTEQLKIIGTTIDIGKEDYESLKSEYDSLKARYDNLKKNLESLTASYEADKQIYERSISGRKGTTKLNTTELEELRTTINNKVKQINTLADELNLVISQLNSTVNKLNALNRDINQKIDTFNKVSLTNGPEFQEGEYVSDGNGNRINIYQYDNYIKLIRVLAHEFGHAIGIDHVEGENSIMYAYNLDSALKISNEDLSALRDTCKID